MKDLHNLFQCDPCSRGGGVQVEQKCSEIVSDHDLITFTPPLAKKDGGMNQPEFDIFGEII